MNMRPIFTLKIIKSCHERIINSLSHKVCNSVELCHLIHIENNQVIHQKNDQSKKKPTGVMGSVGNHINDSNNE
jgi:hypothetical protein